MERNLNVNPDDPSKAASERTIGLLAAVWLFCWFASYFVQQPLRDDFGIVQGVENLPAMFAIVAVVILPVNFAFSAYAGRHAAMRVIGVITILVVTVLGAFALGLHFVGTANESWVARAFFVWVSLFSLFVISLFWGTMASLFPSERAKHWYGILSAGGTLGGVAGAFLVKGTIALQSRVEWLSGERKVTALLAIAAVLFVAGAVCALAISRRLAGRALLAPRPATRPAASALVGLRRCLTSSYLGAICIFLVFYTVTSTVLYLEKQEIVESYFGGDRDGRRAFSADIAIWKQSLSLVGQLLFTSAWLRSLGVARGLAFVPSITIAGFAVVAGNPVLGFIAVFDVARAVAEYVVTRPSREVLYTVVPREEKYEAKVFIDTFVYRLGDALGSGFIAITMWLELGLSTTFLTAIPLAVIWFVVALRLGSRQAGMARAAQEAPELSAGSSR